MSVLPADATLHPAEQALWLMHEMAPGKGLSNLALTLRVGRPIPADALLRAAGWLAGRHSELRVTFPLRGQAPVRHQAPAGSVVPRVTVAPAGPEPSEERLHAFAAAPFPLGDGPLLRVGVFPTTADTVVICLVVHHLVADGSALRVLAEELLQASATFAATGHGPVLPPAPEPAPRPEIRAESVRYWRAHLAGYTPSRAAVHAARPLPADAALTAGRMQRRLSAAARDAVRELRRRLRATDHIVLLSAYYATLMRHGSATDLTVGVMMSNRAAEDRRAVCNRVTTVPARVRIDAGTSWAELVAATRRMTLEALSHAAVPFERLLEEPEIVADADPAAWRGRLFRHLFNFRLTESVAFDAGDTVIDELHTGYSQFDLELIMERHGAELLAKLEYSTEAHDPAFAAAFLDRLELVLITAAADPEQTVSRLDIRTTADRAVIATANATTVESVPTVLESVAGRAAHDPDAIAMTGDDGDITYRQLLTAAESVRAALVAAGAGPGSVVPLAGRRDARTAAAALGIWAAGAAYVPLDPTFPVHRLRMQLDELGARALVDDATLPAGLADGVTTVVPPDPAQLPAAGLTWSPPSPDALAYLIYTSGSTGRPKGVQITHGNLANLVGHFHRELGAGPATAMAWLTTFAFDISALELFLPLSAGGRVVCLPDEARIDPDRMLRAVDAHDVTVLQATPTTWRLVAPHARGRLIGRQVLCGGEPMSPALRSELAATGARIRNVYGPTETTIWSTAAEISGTGGTPVTIGRPVANTVVQILDEHGTPLPPYISGELCIGGAGVGTGYWHRPELTAARFGTHPELGRFYRTGDAAMWRADGCIELAGRADRQIKILGHRVELGEVENALLEHPAVRNAVAVLRRPDQGDPYLVAFAVADGEPPTVEQLWERLAARLPRHCIPTRIGFVAGLPTTPNSKVDHARVAAWPDPAEPRTVAQENGTAPPGGLTDQFTALWRDLLGAADADTNFFLSGGNSLLAVRLVIAARRLTSAPLSLMTVYAAPTPAKLAEAVATAGTP